MKAGRVEIQEQSDGGDLCNRRLKLLDQTVWLFEMTVSELRYPRQTSGADLPQDRRPCPISRSPKEN